MESTILGRMARNFHHRVKTNPYGLSFGQYTNMLDKALDRFEPNIKLIRAKAKRKPRLVVPREAAEFKIDFKL